jgi:carbamoyltransferase
MSTYILGIHAGHDASATLLKDGIPVFASEEERYNLIKHYGGFPAKAIETALEYERINIDDIDYFAFSPAHYLTLKNASHLFSESVKMMKNLYSTYGFNEVKAVLSERLSYYASYRKKTKEHSNFRKNISYSFDHHQAHLASSYYCSGFTDAACASWDYAGGSTSTLLGHAINGEIIKKYNIGFPNSLGYLYAYITKYLGFQPWGGEGKVMGLAPYGKDNFNFGKLIRLQGYIHKINPDYLNLIDFEKSFYDERDTRFSSRIKGLLGEPFVKPKFDKRAANIASSLQAKIEEIGIKILKKLTKELGTTNVCIAGGLGLNCKLNGKIITSDFVDNIFVQPAAGDGGLSLGAALKLNRRLGNINKYVMKEAYLGPEFNKDQIETELLRKGFSYTKQNDISNISAELLAEGNIIGWFQGRMEFGPRALGNRSVLSDPRDKRIRDRSNRLKGREIWRPVAPSMLAETAEDYLENYYPSPFMTLTFKVREDKLDEVEGIVHVDGTCRPQTVEKEINPRYWSLISEFQKITGIPCVINTSFNAAGLPIACSPSDALFNFEKMGLDYLAIGDYLIEKREDS